MARIRSIKPEFPQSESLGRVSRDARLLFVNLFTIVDDVGRARANSRMLASLLYPYDDGEEGHPKTTGKDIDGWLVELERENCVRRYEVDGNTYLDIPKWLEHQKIDHPSKSKLPEYREPVAHPREPLAKLPEALAPDLDRKGEDRKGPGREGSAADAAPPPRDDGLELPATLDQTPEGQAVKAYNAVAERIGLGQCQKLGTSRRSKLKARLADCGGLDGWAAALAKLEASSFCRGRNDRGWKADFDFLCQDKSFTRLMEGFYDDRNRTADTADDRAAILAGLGIGGVGAAPRAA